MYKSTLQQIVLFIITSVLIYQTGKYVIALKSINSFADAGIVMSFFIIFILFVNYFTKLTSKLFRVLYVSFK